MSNAAEIRRWAKAHGLAVAERGRLAPHVVAAYEEAQASVVDAAPSARRLFAKDRWDWQRH